MARWTTFRWGDERFAVASEPLVERPELTAAEQAVFALLIEGKSNADIARARGASVRTVANQVASVLKKFGVGSRSELAARVQS